MKNFRSEADFTDPMFLVLSEKQIVLMLSYGAVQRVSDGEKILRQGDSSFPFFLVLEGALVVKVPQLGELKTVATHRQGQFFGDAGMLTGRSSLVDVEAEGDGQVLRIERAPLQELIRSESELGEILIRAFLLRRVSLIAHGLGDIVLLGQASSSSTLTLQEFLSRNGHPYSYLDVADDETTQAVLDQFNISIEDLPVTICQGKYVLRNPSIRELTDCLGLNAGIQTETTRDLVVVGGGPSGLAAAVYAASEGLDVLVLEGNALGGQAGTSSKIENYLGFPMGISGQELATSAFAQAQKFGAQVLLARSATQLNCDRNPYSVQLDDGSTIRTRSIVIATGARYRKLPISNRERFEGAGIYYGATRIEAQLCKGEEVVIVGGGNSAGQAAVFLSGWATHVHVLIRGESLRSSMSRYLIRRIERSNLITVHPSTEITALNGASSLDHIRWIDRNSNQIESRDIRHVFLMTGAQPNTEWLAGCLELDDKGFVKTGSDVMTSNLLSVEWPNGTRPELLETSLPGVFAVGDVRAGNVKRVASAVGEGSIVIHLVHRFLERLNGVELTHAAI